MASLIITSGEQKGEYLLLGNRINVIGRAEALPMQILDDMVSRKHLRIRYDENSNQHYAEDMESKHGVIINNHKITQLTPLKDGDQIVIGQTHFYTLMRISTAVKVPWSIIKKSANASVQQCSNNSQRFFIFLLLDTDKYEIYTDLFKLFMA